MGYLDVSKYRLTENATVGEDELFSFNCCSGLKDVYNIYIYLLSLCLMHL